MLVSIVVATLGRPSLEDCIKSWMDQTYSAFEFIIVADGSEAKVKTERILAAIDTKDILVTVLSNTENRGASYSYNKALEFASCEAIALTSDDDLWLPTKLEKQILELEKGISSVVLTGAYYRRKNKWIERPRKVISENLNPLIDVFSRRTFPWTTARYIPMSSILFRREATIIRFDESLNGYEDFGWLHNAYIGGFKISQLKDPLVRVNTDLARSVMREIEIDSEFITGLDKIELGMRGRFLSAHFIRPFIYQGQFNNVKKIRKEAYRNKIKTLPDFIEAVWQYSLTGMVQLIAKF